MNSIMIIGNLTKAPEASKSGEYTIAKFTVAVNSYEKGQQETDYFYCSAIGRDAENILKYCDKGSTVAVHGPMRSFKSEKGTLWTVKLREIQFLSHRKSADATPLPSDFQVIDDGDFPDFSQFESYAG